MQNYISLIFWFPWTLGMSNNGNTFFSDLRNPISLHKRKKQTKNTRQIAKPHKFAELSSQNTIIASEDFVLNFLSYLAHFASCLQCCRYIR